MELRKEKISTTVIYIARPSSLINHNHPFVLCSFLFLCVSTFVSHNATWDFMHFIKIKPHLTSKTKTFVQIILILIKDYLEECMVMVTVSNLLGIIVLCVHWLIDLIKLPWHIFYCGVTVFQDLMPQLWLPAGRQIRKQTLPQHFLTCAGKLVTKSFTANTWNLCREIPTFNTP